MAVRVFLLPTQYDIIDFRQGNRPENILVRDFATPAERLAYEDGIDAVVDPDDRIEGLAVTGTKVVYVRCPEDSENPGGEPEPREASFGSFAEAEAFRRGLEDAEGRVAPLLVDETDERFEQLQEWVGVGAGAAGR